MNCSSVSPSTSAAILDQLLRDLEVIDTLAGELFSDITALNLSENSPAYHTAYQTTATIDSFTHHIPEASLVARVFEPVPACGYPDPLVSSSSQHVDTFRALDMTDDAWPVYHSHVESTNDFSTESASVHTSSFPWSPFADFTTVNSLAREVGAVESTEEYESERTTAYCGPSPSLSLLTERPSYEDGRSQSSSTSPASSPSSSLRSARRHCAPGLRTYKGQDSPRKSPRTAEVRAPRSIQVPLDWPCPEPALFVCPICGHFQANRRTPDLRRHIDTHYAAARRDWVCCGVPVNEAWRHGITDLSTAELDPATGRVMVGGCWTLFTRKDAYMRHLQDYKDTCIGDANAEWVPGNVRQPPRRST